MTGSSSEIVFAPLPVDDPFHRQPDISFARSALAWEPTVALRDGLAQAAQYFRQFVHERVCCETHVPQA